MFTKRIMLLLRKYTKNSNNYHLIMHLNASFDISLNGTNAKLARERSGVMECIGVQVSKLI